MVGLGWQTRFLISQGVKTPQFLRLTAFLGYISLLIPLRKNCLKSHLYRSWRAPFKCQRFHLFLRCSLPGKGAKSYLGLSGHVHSHHSANRDVPETHTLIQIDTLLSSGALLSPLPFARIFAKITFTQSLLQPTRSYYYIFWIICVELLCW